MFKEFGLKFCVKRFDWDLFGMCGQSKIDRKESDIVNMVLDKNMVKI